MLGQSDARHDSSNRRSLSHKAPPEGRKAQGVSAAPSPSSCGGARRGDNNGHSLPHNAAAPQRKETHSVSEKERDQALPQETPRTELAHFEQSGRCAPDSSCEAECADRDAGRQEHSSTSERSASASVTVTALPNDSSDKTAGTTETHEKPAYFVQVMVTFAMAWGVLAASTGLSFPGVVLPQFTDPDTNDLYLDPQTLALFASFVSIGTMVGSLVAGQLLAPLGARLTILIGLPLGMVSWLGLVFSSQLWILMTCRVLQGCVFAMVKPPTLMYLVEIAHESLRGRLVGVVGIAKEIGFFSSYILGGLMLTWRQLSLVFACMLVPPAIAVFFSAQLTSLANNPQPHPRGPQIPCVLQRSPLQRGCGAGGGDPSS